MLYICRLKTINRIRTNFNTYQVKLDNCLNNPSISDIIQAGTNRTHSFSYIEIKIENVHVYT